MDVGCGIGSVVDTGERGRAYRGGNPDYVAARPHRAGGTDPNRRTGKQPDNVRLKPVKFYIDDKLFGEAAAGPPYALEWTDDNPFEPREIVAEACDEDDRCVRDRVQLKPLKLEQSQVSSVLLEASVQDRSGHYIGGLTMSDFSLAEDNVLQELNLVTADTVDSTYTLLLDCSQSMSRRMDFVQQAAARLLRFLRPNTA